jgi:ubiquinone/menaquinone biosynthesis C-methylase UbiE
MHEATIDCCTYFTGLYEENAHPAFKALERSVLGCDYGGTSWTTQAQADRIPGLLELDHASHLLEIGSGTGWPGVYVCRDSGCALTLLDLPANALARAVKRVAEEGVSTLRGAVSASGAQLPFAASSFDAIGHSDVLCCLPEKHEMLSECRRVARKGARMLIFVIRTAGNLNEKDMAEAIEAGPPFVETPLEYAGMLGESRWQLLYCESVNEEYLKSLQRMVDGLEANADTFSGLMEPGEFQETLERRRRQARAVESGLLVREVFLAEAA